MLKVKAIVGFTILAVAVVGAFGFVSGWPTAIAAIIGGFLGFIATFSPAEVMEALKIRITPVQSRPFEFDEDE